MAVLVHEIDQTDIETSVTDSQGFCRFAPVMTGDCLVAAFDAATSESGQETIEVRRLKTSVTITIAP